MSATKRYLEQISLGMGLDGDITPEVLAASVIQVPCKVCQRMYNEQYVQSIHGDLPVIHGCCSNECYRNL